MFFAYISILLLVLIHQTECAMEATADMYRNGTNTTGGTLRFFQMDSNSSVSVTGSIYGLASNSTHGFHVHVNGVSKYTPDCASAGDHFNPYNTTHGPITANINSRHVGDLGNLMMNDSGSVYVNISDSIIQLYNATQSIANRTIIIHLNSDDFGLGNTNTSNTTGNSGARVLCGLIVLTSNGSMTTTTTTVVTTTTTVVPTTTNQITTTTPFTTTTSRTTTTMNTTMAVTTTTSQITTATAVTTTTSRVTTTMTTTTTRITTTTTASKSLGIILDTKQFSYIFSMIFIFYYMINY